MTCRVYQQEAFATEQSLACGSTPDIAARHAVWFEVATSVIWCSVVYFIEKSRVTRWVYILANLAILIFALACWLRPNSARFAFLEIFGYICAAYSIYCFVSCIMELTDTGPNSNRIVLTVFHGLNVVFAIYTSHIYGGYSKILKQREVNKAKPRVSFGYPVPGPHLSPTVM
jgi:hypothetical protein